MLAVRHSSLLQADGVEEYLLGGDDCHVNVWLIFPSKYKKGSNQADI